MTVSLSLIFCDYKNAYAYFCFCSFFEFIYLLLSFIHVVPGAQQQLLHTLCVKGHVSVFALSPHTVTAELTNRQTFHKYVFLQMCGNKRAKLQFGQKQQTSHSTFAVKSITFCEKECRYNYYQRQNTCKLVGCIIANILS